MFQHNFVFIPKHEILLSSLVTKNRFKKRGKNISNIFCFFLNFFLNKEVRKKIVKHDAFKYWGGVVATWNQLIYGTTKQKRHCSKKIFFTQFKLLQRWCRLVFVFFLFLRYSFVDSFGNLNLSEGIYSALPTESKEIF